METSSGLISLCVCSAGARDDHLPFLMELWDDADQRVDELIALTGDYAVACSAYGEAVKCRRPGTAEGNTVPGLTSLM